MKLSGHQAILRVCVAGCALIISVCIAGAESRASQRVQPVFENSVAEKPIFARPGKTKPHRNIAPQIEFPPLEKLQPDRVGHEKPNREKVSLAAPNTVEVFRRPRDFNETEEFRRGSSPTISRYHVPGAGKNLAPYRLGERAQIRGHNITHHSYHFRNPDARKPDAER